MKLSEISTPAFVIDYTRLLANLELMKSRASAAGVRLRPHTKTHKTREIAALQMDASRSITVSTLAEAEFFFESGIRDITYAVPILPEKLERVSRLLKMGADLKLLVDHPSLTEVLNSEASDRGVRFKLMLKIDSGYGRAGFSPESEEGLRMARDVHDSENLDLEGILTHAGHSYACRNSKEIAETALEEQNALARFATRMSDAGIPCPVISAGSTPTSMHADEWGDVNEIRPGCYVFFDKYQVDIGTCRLEDCSAFILAGIIGSYPERNQLLIDAGALAFSKDPGPTHLRQPPAFGLVREYPGLYVTGISQEHGIITSNRPVDFDKFRIGGKLSIIPNHCCLAAALFPKYHIVNADEVTDTWKPVRGW